MGERQYSALGPNETRALWWFSILSKQMAASHETQKLFTCVFFGHRIHVNPPLSVCSLWLGPPNAMEPGESPASVDARSVWGRQPFPFSAAKKSNLRLTPIWLVWMLLTCCYSGYFRSQVIINCPTNPKQLFQIWPSACRLDLNPSPVNRKTGILSVDSGWTSLRPHHWFFLGALSTLNGLLSSGWIGAPNFEYST